MTAGLTARQTRILKCLIDEYINTTEAVGSEILEKKYSLGVSSATIRNEMHKLTRLGYLRQPHTSAGRVPTPLAMKFYITQLMEEKQMSLADEVRAKEEVWDSRANTEALMEEAVHALANQTKSLAIGATDEGKLWHAGHSNFFTYPGCADLGVCASVFSLLDEIGRVQQLFFQGGPWASPVEVLFGEELGWRGFEPVSVVATRFDLRGHAGALGVIGPSRLQYSTVIPTLRYFGNLISEVANA